MLTQATHTHPHPNPLPKGEGTGIARAIRRRVLQMSHAAHAPHLASALSCIDILVAAYWGALKIESPDDPDRDRLIFSKGHAAIGLYATLAARGIIAESLLDSFGLTGGTLAEQPIPHAVPGVEAATGSLGHGLSLGIGMAMAARIQKRDYRVLVVMSDGECNEGSVWEAAMFAPAQRLDRLAVVIDFNKWQATGRSQEVMALAPLRDKWQAFGWEAIEVDGHDIETLAAAMRMTTPGKPRAIIAHTLKGKGVSFMQDDNNWHYRIPSDADLAAALAELN
ncbi:MAG: transketolase [Phycisphaeraceae bacterium]